uniref:DDE-1 domain-containing protein n=1 Tax=Amphimedon queenslandica TaxID=400682 RepID=A0A1X7SFZ8_AMPQE
MEDIPSSLIINWDQTAVQVVPSCSWTMEKKGTKRIEVAAIDDKRQITAVFGCTLSGNFLPIQLIYQGKTTKCLPNNIDFPRDWQISFTDNHWSNEKNYDQICERNYHTLYLRGTLAVQATQQPSSIGHF